MKKQLIFTAMLALWANSSAADLILSRNDTERKDPPALQPISMTQVAHDNYIIGPGDFFEITADFQSFVVQVSPEGYISINRVGGAKVSDLKLSDAKKAILGLLAKRFDPSRCFVQLSKMRNQSIGVFGAVTTPAYFEIPASTKASQAIYYANGLSKSAQVDSIMIIHAKGDTSYMNLLDIRLRGQLQKDPSLQLGDVIYVPKVNLQKELVYTMINGTSTPMNYKRNATIADYLDYAGILSDFNGYAGVYWASAKGRKFISFEEASKTQAQPGDTLDILQDFGKVYVGGMVQKSGPATYMPNARPIDYIVGAGTSVMADQIHRIRVVRKGGKFEYIDPIQGKLYPGDYIELDMSAIDYANRWLPMFSTALGAASLIWGIYYATVWVPNHTK